MKRSDEEQLLARLITAIVERAALSLRLGLLPAQVDVVVVAVFVIEEADVDKSSQNFDRCLEFP